MKIRYLGWLETDNLGDIALYQSIKELFEPYALHASTADPDAVMIGGGTLLFRSTFLDDFTTAIETSEQSFVFGAGVAHPRYVEAFRPALWRTLLNECFYVGVRGPWSFQLLRNHGFSGPVEVIGDPALLVQPEPTGERDPNGRSIVINICNPRRARSWGFDNETVRTAVVEAARQLIQSGWSLTFVSFESRNDRYIQSAISEIRSAQPIEFVAGYCSLKRTMDILRNAHMVIGEKLHSIVLAAAAGAPFISLAYQPKCCDFAISVGQEEFLLPLERLTASHIISKVERIEDNYAELNRRLDAQVALYRQKLHQAASTVRERLRTAGRKTERGLPAAAGKRI